MKLIITVISVLFLTTVQLVAQESESISENKLEAMSIPSSPAFSLLGVNPEIVTRPSDVKEFKVDWRIKNYKVAPDLALEAQPLWWLIYRKRTSKEFLNMSSLERILSTATVSVATAKVDNVNHLAYAMKFNLYKAYDPYSDTDRIEADEAKWKKDSKELESEISNLKTRWSTATNKDSSAMLLEQLNILEYEKKELRKIHMDAYAAENNKVIAEKWNTSMVDMAIGRVYKYDNAALDSLRFDKAGFGIWIIASRKMGENGLLTGILKMNKIGENRNTMMGASFRYGSNKFNFFTELVRTRMNNVPLNGFAEEEQFADLRSDDLGTGWFKYADGKESIATWTLAYGGDFRLGRKILLNFALRSEFTSGMKLTRFLPVANIICLMN